MGWGEAHEPKPTSWSDRIAARTQMERAARQFIAKPTTGNQEALALALEELDRT